MTSLGEGKRVGSFEFLSAWVLLVGLGAGCASLPDKPPVSGPEPNPVSDIFEIVSPAPGESFEGFGLQVPVELRVAEGRVVERVTITLTGDVTLTRYELCGGEQAPCAELISDSLLRFDAPAFYGGNFLEIEAVDSTGDAASASQIYEMRPYFELASYELLVITPQEFVSAVQPLLSHKNATGMPAMAVTLESIYQDPKYASGRDPQEMIKLAIAEAQRARGVKYVLLLGDVDRFPVRYTRNWDDVHWGHGYPPSDLYYADLYDANGQFDDWDGDGDGLFGEMNSGDPSDWKDLNQDDIDLEPDVAVGRIPASTSAEVTTMVDKIITYESTGALTWKQRILLVTGNFDNPHPTADHIASLLAPQGFTARKHYWTTDWTTIPETDPQYFSKRAALLNSEMDDGVAFSVYMGHGSGGWPGQTGGNGGKWEGWYAYHSIAALQNEHRLPVVLAAACDTAMFNYPHWPYETKTGGIYTPPNLPNPQQDAPEPAALQPQSHDLDTMAEHFLVKSDVGGIAYIGGYTGVQRSSFKVVQRFFEEYAALMGTATLGDVWSGGVKRYIAQDFAEIPLSWGKWWAAAVYHHIQKMPLFGDPSLRLGGLSDFYSICDLKPWVCKDLKLCAGPGCRIRYINRGDPIRVSDPRDRFLLYVDEINRTFGEGPELDELPQEVALRVGSESPGLIAAVLEEDGEQVVADTAVEAATTLRFHAESGRRYLLVLRPAKDGADGGLRTLGMVVEPTAEGPR